MIKFILLFIWTSECGWPGVSGTSNVKEICTPLHPAAGHTESYVCEISDSTDYGAIPLESVALRLSLASHELAIPFLQKLKKLDIFFNYKEQAISNVVRLPTGTFSNVEHLRELNIYNGVLKLDDYTFYSLSQLVTLRLPDHGITNLSINTFSGLSRLRHLDLASNLLTSLTDGMFNRCCAELQTLSLGKNAISGLHNWSFNGIKALKVLDVHCNKVRELHHSSFQNLQFLVDLNLSDNQLSEIEPYTFNKLSNLKLLFLDKNNLTKVNENIFKGLTSLTSLNLRSNFIKTLPFGVFDALENLTSLDLSDNPLNCTCELHRSLKKLTENTAWKILRLENTVCMSTSDMEKFGGYLENKPCTKTDQVGEKDLDDTEESKTPNYQTAMNPGKKSHGTKSYGKKSHGKKSHGRKSQGRKSQGRKSHERGKKSHEQRKIKPRKEKPKIVKSVKPEKRKSIKN